MTDSDHALDAIGRAAADLMPQLTDRLRRHGLGEIEVVDGDLRVRVRGTAGALNVPADAPADPPPPVATRPDGLADTADPGDMSDPAVAGSRGPVPVGSPAVGFFVYADGLGPGLEVGTGDPLGHVEMLGVRHDVRAPRSGTVRNLVAESGEAVEYGQVVVELDAAEAVR